MSDHYVLLCPDCDGTEFKGLKKAERLKRNKLSTKFHVEAQARHDEKELKFFRGKMAAYVARGWWFRVFHKPPGDRPGKVNISYPHWGWWADRHDEKYEGPDPGPEPCERCEGKGALRVDETKELEPL